MSMQMCCCSCPSVLVLAAPGATGATSSFTRQRLGSDTDGVQQEPTPREQHDSCHRAFQGG